MNENFNPNYEYSILSSKLMHTLKNIQPLVQNTNQTQASLFGADNLSLKFKSLTIKHNSNDKSQNYTIEADRKREIIDFCINQLKPIHNLFAQDSSPALYIRYLTESLEYLIDHPDALETFLKPTLCVLDCISAQHLKENVKLKKTQNYIEILANLIKLHTPTIRFLDQNLNPELQAVPSGLSNINSTNMPRNKMVPEPPPASNSNLANMPSNQMVHEPPPFNTPIRNIIKKKNYDSLISDPIRKKKLRKISFKARYFKKYVPEHLVLAASDQFLQTVYNESCESEEDLDRKTDEINLKFKTLNPREVDRDCTKMISDALAIFFNKLLSK